MDHLISAFVRVTSEPYGEYELEYILNLDFKTIVEYLWWYITINTTNSGHQYVSYIIKEENLRQWNLK